MPETPAGPAPPPPLDGAGGRALLHPMGPGKTASSLSGLLGRSPREDAPLPAWVRARQGLTEAVSRQERHRCPPPAPSSSRVPQRSKERQPAPGQVLATRLRRERVPQKPRAPRRSSQEDALVSLMGRHRGRGPAFLVLLLLSARIGQLSGESVCPNGTFSSSTGCEPCRICDAIERQTRLCSGSQDARCVCKTGYDCGIGDQCGSCPCQPGQERDGDGVCQVCPKGRYNSQRTGRCKPWSRCPADRTEERGTETRDVTCRPPSRSPSQAPGPGNVTVTRIPGAESPGSFLLSISLAGALLACVLLFLFLLLCAAFRAWAQGSMPAAFVKAAPLRQLAQEVDDSSCHYPEEEEGGGREAGGMKAERLLLENHP